MHHFDFLSGYKCILKCKQRAKLAGRKQSGNCKTQQAALFAPIQSCNTAKHISLTQLEHAGAEQSSAKHSFEVILL